MPILRPRSPLLPFFKVSSDHDSFLVTPIGWYGNGRFLLKSYIAFLVASREDLSLFCFAKLFFTKESTYFSSLDMESSNILKSGSTFLFNLIL